MKIDSEQAVAFLNDGHVVALPTETVYGLAACLDQPLAIAKIFALKKRPLVNPLIVHVTDRQELDKYVTDFPPDFERLVKAFWPGPLTVILPIDIATIEPIVRAELPTVGFRVPAQPLTQAIMSKTGALVMPSANLSGRPSSTQPEHVEQDFGENFPVLDGGSCHRGVESTILCYRDSNWIIARMGAISAEEFEEILGYVPQGLKLKENAQPICPGQLFRHYAPQARLFIDEEGLIQATHVLGFNSRIYPAGKTVWNLGSLHQPEQVANRLYKLLRQLDEEAVKTAWIDMKFPSDGLWETIRERLKRAAGL